MAGSPPSYDELANRTSCPAYKNFADESERVLQSDQPEEERKWNWIYESDHMVINLGSQSWGLHAPTYGLNGTIQGSVTFKGGPTYVELVTATLEGKIKTVVVCRQTMHTVLSRTVTLYAPYPGNFTWHQTQNFSIPFPVEVFTQNGTSKLPPSFASYDYPPLRCEVSYVLRLDMVRKGMRRHESRTIPVLYLPKSRPANPPVANIPMPSSRFACVPFCREKCVKTMPLTPKAPKEVDLSGSIYLSLPSPLSFTSGESIPFILSLVFPNAPVLVRLLAPHVRLGLFQRIRVLWNGEPTNLRNTKISTGEVQLICQPTEGVAMLSGVIPAGTAGREYSWRMDEVIEVQYIIRAMVRPPSIVSAYMPTCFHEEPIDINTDPWGTGERELAATGGLPAPALGLACNIEKPPPSSQF